MYFNGGSCCQSGGFPYQNSYPFFGGCGCGSNNNSSSYAIILVLFILLVIVLGSRFTR